MEHGLVPYEEQPRSPPLSAVPTSPSLSLRRKSSPLSLDLSCVPPLITPKPPSNTLLLTNLNNLDIFRPDHLLTVRDLVHRVAPIYSWSPLKSFRRVVVSFYDVDSAIRIRNVLDGEDVMGERVRIFFGAQIAVGPVDQHLHAPESQKLHFISPPPSPPHGWEVRNEGPPNRQVHAEDLASALSSLHAPARADAWKSSPTAGYGDGLERESRARSGSTTMIYVPADHGNSPDLPAIAVEDLTCPSDAVSPVEESFSSKPAPHTSRPPVELMHDT